MKRITYANVVSSVAMFLALGGSSLAVNHYIITNKNQIAPKVRHQLEGGTFIMNVSGGPTGEQGRPGQNAETQVWYVYRPQVGPPGEQGKTGATGPTGPRGATGP